MDNKTLLQELYDNYAMPIAEIIKSSAYDAVRITSRFYRINIEELLKRRYTTYRIEDPSYIDVFRSIKKAWIRNVERGIPINDFIKILPHRLHLRVGNRVSQENVVEQFKWYIYGLFLTDGALMYSNDAMNIHTTNSSMIALSTTIASITNIFMTMIREYKNNNVLFRIYFRCEMYGVGNALKLFNNNEKPSNDEELAQFLAGIIDGDGNVDSKEGKVRISLRYNPKNSFTKKKNMKILQALVENNIVENDTLHSKTFLKYDYLSIKVSKERILKLLEKCLRYVLIPNKRIELERILSSRYLSEDDINILMKILSDYNLKIKCRTKRTQGYSYKIAYVRHRDLELLRKLKKRICGTIGCQVNGPYKVDSTRYEIVFPERLSRYICEE